MIILNNFHRLQNSKFECNLNSIRSPDSGTAQTSN